MAGNLALRHFIKCSFSDNNIGLIKAIKCEQGLASIYNIKCEYSGAVHRAQLKGVFPRSQSTVVGCHQLQALIGNPITINVDQGAVGHQPNVRFPIQIDLEGNRFLLILHRNTGLHGHLNVRGDCIGNGLFYVLSCLISSGIFHGILTGQVVKRITFNLGNYKLRTETIDCSYDFGEVQRGDGRSKGDFHSVSLQLLIVYQYGDIAVDEDIFFLNTVTASVFDKILTGLA